MLLPAELGGAVVRLGVVLQSSGENLDLEENVGAGHVVVMVWAYPLQLSSVVLQRPVLQYDGIRRG